MTRQSGTSVRGELGSRRGSHRLKHSPSLPALPPASRPRNPGPTRTASGPPARATRPPSCASPGTTVTSRLPCSDRASPTAPPSRRRPGPLAKIEGDTGSGLV